MSDNKRKRKQELTRLRVKRHRKHKAYCSTSENGNKSDSSSASMASPAAASISNEQEFFMDIEQFDLYDENTAVNNNNENLNLTQDSMNNINDENILSDSIEDNDQADFEMDEHSNTDEMDEHSNTDEMDEHSNTDENIDLLEASIDNEDEFYEYNDEFDEITELRTWALSGNPTIPHTRLDELLRILRTRLLPNLPKCSKTFLKTASTNYDIQVNEDSSEWCAIIQIKFKTV
ncbi:Uncharacterized protein DBV15_11219, partial [Temnothorax longispinosus]